VAGGRPRYLYPVVVAVAEAEFPVASLDSWFVLGLGRSFVDCDEEEEEGDKTYAGARTLCPGSPENISNPAAVRLRFLAGNPSGLHAIYLSPRRKHGLLLSYYAPPRMGIGVTVTQIFSSK
jgi:hypothetical protein